MSGQEKLALARIKRIMENGLKAQLARQDRTSEEKNEIAKNVAERVIKICLNT